MKTLKQADNYIKKAIGKGIDFDGKYGYQCADLSVDYMYYITDKKVRMWGNAKDLINNDFKGLATVYKNTPSFLAKKGDVFVMGANRGGGYGHTGIVVSATLNTITVIEQNWLGGGATFSEVTTKRTHAYDKEMWFIRPKLKSEPKPKKSTSKKNTWNWSGKFTANTPIKVRKSASLVDDKNVVDKGSWIKKGDWFDFVQLIKVTKGKKKYWMAKFKYPTNPKAGYFYAALGEVTDKNEKIKKEKKLYGKIKWK